MRKWQKYERGTGDNMFLTRSENILVVLHCIASLELKHFGKKKHVEKRSTRHLSVNPVNQRSTNLNPFFRVVLRPIIANVLVKKTRVVQKAFVFSCSSMYD